MSKDHIEIDCGLKQNLAYYLPGIFLIMIAQERENGLPPIDLLHHTLLSEYVTRNGDPSEIPAITNAFNLAREIHADTPPRGTGEEYITHPVNTALILMRHGILDPDMLSAALIHDVIEDASRIGNLSFVSNDVWLENAVNMLYDEGISNEVIGIILPLTKPKIDGVEIFTVQQRRDACIRQLEEAGTKTLMVKMADRLHNLQTLKGLDHRKALMVIAETQQVLFPIFERAKMDYPKEGQELMDEMDIAIENYLTRRNTIETL